MQSSVCVALVHNNNPVRNDYVCAKIELMVTNLHPDYKVKKIEVSYQSEIVPHGYGIAILRDFMYQQLAYKWQKYRLLRTRKLRDWFGFLRIFFVKYILNQNMAAHRWKTNGAIEVAVTDKHIRAWVNFLDSNADYLIVFEDDVIFKDDSNLRINRLLDEVTNNYLNRACYVNLGGGVSLADLMVTSLERCYKENYRHYQKPVTNTTCAYLVNRELITKFMTIVTRKPWLRLIAIDWMINNLFILMNKEVSSVVCMHADPTIFKHGTFTGEYISWQVNK